MRNNFFNRHLSAKLSLGVLILAIPVFIASLGILFVKSSENIRKEAAEHAESVLNTSMHRLERHLNALVTATNVNAPEVTANLNPDSLQALTHRILRLNVHVDGCSISMEPDMFPKYGRYYSAYSIRKGDSILSVIEKPYNYFQKTWYKSPLEKGEACWVDYYDESNLPEMTLDGMIASYSKPIYNHDGKLLGVISSDLSLERMSKLIASEKPYPNAYFMMLGEGGRYLLHPDATRLFKKTIFTGVSPREHPDIIALGHDMMVDNSGRMEVVLDGVPCLVCYMALPGTPWSLALVCPNEDIMSSYHQFVKTVVVILCIGLLVILFLGSRAVSHAVRPLKQLLLKTQSIAEGNMEVYIPVSKREDAVGRLQNSFTKMLQSLNFHIGITRYITEQTQQRNEELAEATRLVAEADKRKTTFIQNVTHQIRTPLNIVIGFAQVLRDTIAEKANADGKYAKLSDEDVKSIGSTMTRNAILIQRMVVMLFDSSDLGLSEELNSAAPHDTVRCNDVVRESIEHVKHHYADINIGFETELDDDFSILTNHIYLKRSLSEILYNAAKYSDGQHVTARVSRIGNTVRFIIEDRGKGITEEECDSVFEPFMKVDTLSEGLGLGLPLSKRHILTLGGELTLDASYHDGCRIIITLPI